MRVHAFLGWAVAAAALGFAVSGCSKNESFDPRATFFGFHKDPVRTWDPANAYDTISLDVVPSIYETLYQYSYLEETYTVEPLLAASMPKMSKDRLTLTIPIRRGVRFQDDPCFPGGKGRELKAQDFVYGIKRLALPSIESQGFWIFDGKMVGLNAFKEKLLTAPKSEVGRLMGETLEGLKAIDDHTLRIKLLKPYPQILYVLAMSFTSPVPPEAVAKWADEKGNLADHPVGTGPYVLKSWDRDRRLVMERNPNFRGEKYPAHGSRDYFLRGLMADGGKGMPFLDRIVIDVAREAQPRWLNFMKSKVDYLELPKDNFGQAITNGVNLTPELAARGIRLHVETGAVVRYVAINVKDRLLSDKRLRQAISAAIDRDKWIEIFTNGAGKKMVVAVPPGIADRPRNPRVKYDYDIGLAKDLLKKAGYPEGKGLPPLRFDMRGADSTARQLGEFLERQLAAAGIKVDMAYNAFPAYLEKAKRGDLSLSYGGWSMDYPDAENIYQLLYGPNRPPGPNDTQYDAPGFNKMYEKIALMEPGPGKAAVIQRMEDMIQEDVPWAMGYFEAKYELTQPWVQNFRGGDIIRNRYKYLRIDAEAKRRYAAGEQK